MKLYDHRGITFDMDRVIVVGRIGGEAQWKRYTVYLGQGVTLEFYEERTADDYYFPRAEFIKAWKGDSE
jgi:hypothetical protein